MAASTATMAIATSNSTRLKAPRTTALSRGSPFCQACASAPRVLLHENEDAGKNSGVPVETIAGFYRLT
jgi:hypothetical protein